ncbi:MAG TPA: cyclic nucleotide-binding domain-containing protein [Burkholderiales bacterium]|nr:cyclic nucleotide-binding domain-containing protein [Burkholderiales bacterium]
MEDRRIQLLQSMPIFGAIQSRTLEILLGESTGVQVPAGGYFFREGDMAEAMFVLERGRVSVVKRWEGRDYTLRELGAGECFGEMALIDLFPRSASVVALEESSALRITAADLYRVYEADVDQFALIHMNLARELSRRLRTADERLFRAGREGERRGEDSTGHSGA